MFQSGTVERMEQVEKDHYFDRLEAEKPLQAA